MISQYILKDFSTKVMCLPEYSLHDIVYCQGDESVQEPGQEGRFGRRDVHHAQDPAPEHHHVCTSFSYI